jgi:O-antigen/teichoic acid export membrane protein
VSGTKKTLGNFFTHLVMFPITIAVSILVARVLGPSDRGIYAFVLLMGQSLLPILFLGFGVGVLYMISSERYHAKEVTLSCLAIGLGKGIIISLLLGFLWYNQWLGQTAREIGPEVMLPVLVVLPLSGIWSVSTQILKGNSLFGMLNILTLSTALLNAIFLTLFVLILKMSLQGAVIAIILQQVLTNAVVLFIVFRKFKPRFKISLDFIKASYNYGIKGWVGNMASRANEKFDQLILSFFASSTLLGYYAIAFSLVRFIGYLPQAVTPVLFNIVARTKDVQKSAVLTAQVHRAMMISVGILTVGLAIAGYWMIPFLYGEAFRASYIPFLILLPGMFVYMASRRVINKFLGANGFPGKMSIVEGSGAVIGLILYIILIPIMDINGAALGSTVAYIVSGGVALYFFYRLVPRKSVNLFRVSWKDVRWILARLEGAFSALKKVRRRLGI